MEVFGHVKMKEIANQMVVVIAKMDSLVLLVNHVRSVI